MIRQVRRFAVNVLTAEQRELAGRLGKPYARSPQKLEGLQMGTSETGCPVLLETAAWVECAVEGEMPAGDSTLVLARVVGARVLRAEETLTMRTAGFKHAG
jgi:flavin reductase (DIM6/NTAB) family NADH-FMN oxidoreductase RutF